MKKKNFNIDNFKSLRDLFLFYCVYVTSLHNTVKKKNLLFLLELYLRSGELKSAEIDTMRE